MTTLIFILCLFSGVLKAPEYKTVPVLVSEAVNPYIPIVNAVSMVESSGGIHLLNEKENAVGYFGIRPIRLRDYNQRTGKSITHQQCYDYETGKMIFMYYASQYDYRDIKGICVGWNGVSKRNLYYLKVKKTLNSL